MQRTLIVLSLILMVGGVSWYVWNDLNSKDSRITSVAIDESLLAPNKEPDREPDTIIDNSEKISEPKSGDLLESQALKIIGRPILFKESFSESEKQSLAEKIEEVTKELRGDYDVDTPWLLLGAYRKAIGDYEGAIEAWNFLGLMRPQGYVAFHNLGELYGYHLKDYEKSEQNFLKSIENNPTSIDGYNQLATIYEYGYKEKAGKVENLLLSGIKQNPQVAYLRVLLGKYYERMGKTADALKYLKEALKMEPWNSGLESEIRVLENN